MPSASYVISTNFNNYADNRQIITAKEWRTFLQNHDRHIFCNGELRELKAKNLGAGMMEIRSYKLKD